MTHRLLDPAGRRKLRPTTWQIIEVVVVDEEIARARELLASLTQG